MGSCPAATTAAAAAAYAPVNDAVVVAELYAANDLLKNRPRLRLGQPSPLYNRIK